MILHCNKKMNLHFSSLCITSDGVIFVSPAGRNRTNLNKSFKNLYDLKRFVKFLAKRRKNCCKSVKNFLQKVFAKQKKTVYICDINKTDQLYGKDKTRQPPVSAVEVR